MMELVWNRRQVNRQFGQILLGQTFLGPTLFALLTGCQRVQTVAVEQPAPNGPNNPPSGDKAKGHVPRSASDPRSIDAASSNGSPTDTSDLDAKYVEIQWNTLRGLDTRTGQATPLLELLAGTDVRIAGYMVPLDDGFQEAAEFLIVPTAGACIHTPPPPANQIILATMNNGQPAKMELLYSVWVYGRLQIATADSPYGAVGFRFSVVDVRRRG